MLDADAERLLRLAALYLDGHDVEDVPVLTVPEVRAIAARALDDPRSVTPTELAAISLFAMRTGGNARRRTGPADGARRGLAPSGLAPSPCRDRLDDGIARPLDDTRTCGTLQRRR